MTINLPKQPDGHQFEEAMAAAVRAIGYFTENRTVLDHEGREVLELDVVASPATEAFTSKILLDAKKSSAGFSDIFKIYGWRLFLKIPKGCIVHGVEAGPPAQAAFQEVCPKLDVFVEHFDIEKDVNMAAIPILNGGAEEELRHNARLVGWYQLIAERLCVRDFQDLKKKHQGEDIFARVQQYRRACHLAFFESDPLRRAELLYEAYKNDPHISGAAVDWQAKQDGKDQKQIWEAVRNSAEYPWIQHVLSLETKARILIIKNGLEATLDAANNDEMDTFWNGFKLASLPSNFQAGFERLSVSSHRHAVPYILQLYVESCSGGLLSTIWIARTWPPLQESRLKQSWRR